MGLISRGQKGRGVLPRPKRGQSCPRSVPARMMRSTVSFSAGPAGVWMQTKLFEFFAQSKSGQPKPARSFRLVALCQRDGLGEDFASGFGEHASVSVLQLAFLRTRQQLAGEGGEGLASRGCLTGASGKGLANRVGIDGESARGEQQAASHVFQLSNVARPGVCLQ